MPEILTSLNLNWLDLVIIAALIFYAIEGYSVGFLASLLDLTSFLLSFIIGLKGYYLIGNFIQSVFAISAGFANAIGFLVVSSLSEILIGLGLRRLVYMKYFARIHVAGAALKSLDRTSGAILGVISGLILFSFILTVIVALPISLFLKQSVSKSKIGSFLVSNTQGFEKDLNKVFGGAVNDTLNFLTVEPKSDESVSLKFQTKDVKPDPQSEAQMLVLVNRERKARGLSEVVADERLRGVARAHCTDMFKRGYFSHYTPEGLSPFDRMAQADITYTYAGENLALAPSVTMAMQGLMRSPGHKENILSPNFGKLGVGAIDGGVYGQMYCQEFSD